MTPKQAQFVEEYLVDLNATQAAIRAGYSEDTARKIGSENLSKPDIATAIQEALDARAARTRITADRVLQEYARIGFASVSDFTRITEDGDPAIDLSDMTPDQWAAVSEVQVEDFKSGRGEDARDVRRIKVKAHDKLGALNAMSKHLGMDAPTKHALTDTKGNDVEPLTPLDVAKQVAFILAGADSQSGEPQEEADD